MTQPTTHQSRQQRMLSQPVSIRLSRQMIRERARLLGGFALAAVAMSAMTSALYSSIGADFAEVIDDLPAAFDSMTGGADFSTPEGFLQVELFSIVAPGLVSAVAIMVGSRSLAGSEEDGTLPLITTGPVRRSSVVTAAAAATLVAVFAVTVAVAVGVAFGGRVGGAGVGLGGVLAACMHLALLGAAIGSIALAAGALVGTRGAATGSGTIAAVGSYVIDSFFPLNSSLEPWARFSLWHLYAGSQPLANGIDGLHVAILLLVAVVGFAVAVVGFARRDLAS